MSASRKPSLTSAPRRSARYVENPTDADYAAAARKALRDKDLRLAAEQVSAALAMAPQHGPHQTLLEEVVAASMRPLKLFELPEAGAFFGICAARARVLARMHKVDEALYTLFQAAAFRPDTPFLPWAREWVNEEKGAGRAAPETVAGGLLAMIDALSDGPLSEGAHANLIAALFVAERVQAAHAPSSRLSVARSRVLRSLGREEDALALLTAAEGDAGWDLAVERASIHRDRGETALRIAWLLRAREARPEEASTCAALGDAHLEDGALEEAIAAYERGCELDPSSGWALASAAYCRALSPSEGPPGREATPGSAEGRGRLGAMPIHVRDTPAEGRWLALEADLAAYETRLCDPVDPWIRVIRGALARAVESAPGARLRFRARAELAPSPSARLALAEGMAIRERQGELACEPTLPDPGFGPLWSRREDSMYSPAVEPGESATRAVVSLASTPFGWGVWCERGREIAAATEGAHAAQIAAVMARPPPLPSANVDPVLWLHGIQVAAALIVALAPEAAGPAGARLEQLSSLAGTGDWSAAAALLGLRALGERERERCPEIVRRLLRLVPGDDDPLPPSARALAVTGGSLARGEERRAFLRLRARVLENQSEQGESRF
ncbi:MAG: hypothetical protein R3B70_05485 [Polyangiaceae bacterium]